MEIVSATLKTIKGKLTATVISVTSNGITQFEESVFNKFFTHINSKNDLSELELIAINKYFK